MQIVTVPKAPLEIDSRELHLAHCNLLPINTPLFFQLTRSTSPRSGESVGAVIQRVPEKRSSSGVQCENGLAAHRTSGRRRTSMQTSPMVKYNLGLFRRSAIQRIPETSWRFRVLPHITYGSSCPGSVPSHPKSALLHYYRRKNEVELNLPGGSMPNSSGCEAATVEAARYSDLLRRVVVEIYRGFGRVQTSKKA
ncbi:hypothetical protein B0H14DRAFT_3634104 [Mycena olivaceomarginata]|nr:hypothetical protein B0H14DRAFT_3634104 [Mycena olivaceomarginata]